MRKKVTIYLNDEVAASLEKAAKAGQMAFSSYCSKLICDAAGKLPDESSSADDEDAEDFGSTGETVHVRLKGETGALLRKKASELHLTPTEWVRNVVHRKDLRIHYVKLDDLEKLLDIYGRHEEIIKHVYEACRESGKFTDFDLKMIAQQQNRITALVLAQLSATFEKREKEQEKLKKKYMERM